MASKDPFESKEVIQKTGDLLRAFNLYRDPSITDIHPMVEHLIESLGNIKVIQLKALREELKKMNAKAPLTVEEGME